MVDAQWLQTLGELTSQLLSAEYSEVPDDAQLLSLLQAAHRLYVQVREHVEGVAGLDVHDESNACTGPCLYLSSKPNSKVRKLVMALRGAHDDDKQVHYTRLVELVADSDNGSQDLPLCAVTGIPCQQNSEARVRSQLLAEATRALQYAQALIKSRVLELEAQEELRTSLHGGASLKALADEFHKGRGPELVNTLSTCIPCDASMLGADVGSVDAVLQPLVNAIPPRMRPQAPLVKHAFAKRWHSAVLS